VNYLLNENLSPRLINRLNELFPGLTHVRDLGLKRADDIDIWNWAKANEFAIIATDADFVALAERLGWPPKIVHLKQCDHPLRVIEELLRRNAVRMSEFEKDDTLGLLALRFAPKPPVR
jgi:predicted nuclease of predicted toxin-antitoxin system